MNNRYIAFALTFALSAASTVTTVAQDSTKKSNATVVKPTYKAKPATYAYASQSPAAQQPGGAPVNTDKSLNGQYQYLATKVYNYQKPQLAAFYKNVNDTLRTERKKVRDLQAKLAEQGKAVKNLQSDVDAKEQSLSESNLKVDSISLLGMPVSKSAYNSLMWGLVIVFGAVAAIVIFQSGSARREAKYRIKLYEELDEEYKAYKVKANEKEKKLARELQTERNKLDELLGRG
ncbi:hypothetical protein [Mucilaginibacter aquatilis]|uniref:tRNA (Guanine-N1)-methyltransferase n=1 Tax=Mucilaginibacter aquatilis TaxID=1517760 RepID=A0A6I4I4M1_9SPHI|nr:hypothetical protein [Mucilaginibacter aquatilis]MVN90021.1 hypothetical protein [Mucilaginibacter aquatilis]